MNTLATRSFSVNYTLCRHPELVHPHTNFYARTMKRIHDKNNFIWLTLALIGMLLTGQFSVTATEFPTLQFLEYSSVALLVLSLLSLRASASWARTLLVILAALIAMVIIRGATQHELAEYVYLFLLLAFMVTAAWMVAGEVLLTGSVDLNKIIGAVALYLLLGLIWSILYVITLEISPGALKGIEPAAWYDNLSVTTYFSFVTLTTLGYGDISPATPLARVLVILEAICGMFYLAVIVASLVGSLREERKGDSSPSD